MGFEICNVNKLWAPHELNKFGSDFGSRMLNELWVFHKILVFLFQKIFSYNSYFMLVFVTSFRIAGLEGKGFGSDVPNY